MGSHPLQELINDTFIPNDIEMNYVGEDVDQDNIMVITGPNG